MEPHDPAATAQSGESDWKELAERLLHHPYPGGPARAAEVLLHRLPDHFPADVPVPSEWRLLGSKTYGQGGQPWIIEAVLDAPGTESELLAGYESQVAFRGWAIFETPEPMHGGFTSGIHATNRAFRVDGTGPILRITVAARENMPADVRLNVDWETPRRAASHPHGVPPSAERMPTLRSPEGVPLAAGISGGGGDDRWYSYATAKTDMPASALAAYLAEQLGERGWTQIAGRVDDVATWSSWRLPGDGDWHGFLVVIEAFAHGQRSLFLQIEAGLPDDE